MLQYSFTEHPIFNIFNKLEKIIPNVRIAFAMFSDRHKTIKLYSLEDKKYLSTKSKLPIIQKNRSKKNKPSWISIDMIDFIGSKENKIKQLSISDENENNILVLKFISPYDNLYDILYIEIKKSSILQLVRGGKELTVNEKTLVGNILYSSFSTILNSEYNNIKTHKLIIDSFKNQQDKIKLKNKNNIYINKKLNEYIDYFLKTIANKIKLKEGFNIEYSPTLVSYILSLTEDLEIIEKSIIQTIYNVKNLSLYGVNKILIEPENIIIIKPEPKNSTPNFYNKHQNVIDILDKYEKSAKELNKLGLKINGTNVAKQCSPSITPAAISFNLKKYSTVIVMLLNKHEEKWSVIRNCFKPLINIIDKNNISKTA